MSATVHQLKSTLGGYVRRGNEAGAEQARRDLRAALLVQHAAKVAAGWPELTDEQKTAIRTVLAPVGAP